MSDGYAGERLIIGALLSANWSACRIYGPNERAVPPTASSDPSAPLSYIAWDISYDRAEQITMDGGDQVDGSVDFSIWQERGTGDTTIRAHMDRLDALFKAADGDAIQFFTGVPGDYEPEDPWYGRLYSIPFIRWDLLSAEDLATLAGVGSTSRTVGQAAHGFAEGEWLAWSASADAWIKALAAPGEPRSVGVVSLVPSDDAFVLVGSGFVSLPGVTYTDGPLYLSSVTRGAATSTPPSGSGVSQELAVAIGPHDLIVLSMPQVDLS